MKKIVTFSLGVLFFLFLQLSFAQSFDEKRMATDLEVAKEILSTVLKQKLQNQNQYHYMCCENVESSYIKDYGVRFEINSYDRPYVLYLTDVTRKGMESIEKTVEDIADEVSPSREKGDKKAPFNKEDLIHFTSEAAESFLIQYGHLIGQLRPSDKITVTIGPRDIHRRKSFNSYSWSGNTVAQIATDFVLPSITLSVLKSDLDAYKQGKINEETLKSKNEKVEIKKDNRSDEGAEVFSTILDRIYSSDLSKTYYISGQSIDYYRLENVGLVFAMKVYSSNINGDKYSMPTLDLKGLTRDERNAKVKGLYPLFINDLKENLLKYGSLINSLNVHDMIMLKIGMTECIDCGLPSKLEINVKKQVVMDFDTGKISKEDALNKIEVKEIKESK